MITVKFHAIDSWNRPVFKEVGAKAYYGSTDELFSYQANRDYVLENINLKDLVYFGSKFDCEPLGTLPTEELELWKH